MTVGGGGGAAGTGGAARKRQRVGASSRLSSTAAVIIAPDEALAESYHKPFFQNLRPSASSSRVPPIYPASTFGDGGFNDPGTADVVLLLYIEHQPYPTLSPPSPSPSDNSTTSSAVDSTEMEIYLHSSVLRRSKYFSALLSDRWQKNEPRDDDNKDDIPVHVHRFKLGVPAAPDSISNHLAVLQLLYTDDFASIITTASTALSLLPVALELLFEDCVKACVKFLEVVPWTEEEEKRVLDIIPFLNEDESQELLARVLPANSGSSEEMLYGLIVAATHNHPNMAFAKAFVAKLLRDFSSKASAKRVLDRAFDSSLKVVKEALEEYSSPDFRGDNNEMEAIQRVHLHTAMTNGRHLLWLMERMIELRVADKAVKEWSEQASFTANLQRAFKDDALRNILPGLPAVMLRCTCKLANAVAAGSILAARPIRMKMVTDWLPVLIACKDNVSPMMPSHKSLYAELEETFLKIISTLPMSDAQELLQQCLSFSTRNVEDCPHLVSAFTTWFRRANLSLGDDLSQ